MSRAALGLIIAAVLTPLLVSGIVTRCIIASRTARLVAMLAVMSACAACGAILEREMRQCYREAYTVPAMDQCRAQYPQHGGTITDKIAQPVGELERHLNGRNRREMYREDM